MGMLEVTCVPAIMEETLIREYTVNLPTHRLGSSGQRKEDTRLMNKRPDNDRRTKLMDAAVVQVSKPVLNSRH